MIVSWMESSIVDTVVVSVSLMSDPKEVVVRPGVSVGERVSQLNFSSLKYNWHVSTHAHTINQSC